MRVLLISANTETINMVPLPLGLNCVAVAVRNAGHDVRMLDLMGSGDNSSIIAGSISDFAPDVIGISVRNIDNQQMSETRFLLEPVRDTVRACRACSGATIVLGGAGFSIFPEATLEYLQADMGICGEGEVAFSALLQELQRGGDLSGIAGLCLPGAKVQKGSAERAVLTSLPLPDPAFWSVPAGEGAGVPIPFQTRRGCPMRCSYCSTPSLEGTPIRIRAIDAAVEGIARHVAAGYRDFYFVDNTFNFPPGYAKDLCSAITSAKLEIRWRCILYPAAIDEELAGKMAEAGCVEASLGFESGSLPVLRNLNKKFDPAAVRAASDLLKKYGIRRMGFLLLGAPGECRESVQESLDFAESLELDMLKVSVGIRIYPETALAAAAREEGVLEEGDNLLFPRFYLAKGLNEWLPRMAADWVAKRPYAMM